MSKILLNAKIGDQFGKLTIVALIPSVKGKKRQAMCRCECGIEKPIRLSRVVNGYTKSCHCLIGIERRRRAIARRDYSFQPDDPTARYIPLSQGLYAIIDAKLYDYLNQWIWSAVWYETSHGFYAFRNERGSDGKGRAVLMHRQILGLGPGDPREGDHGLQDTLDNRMFVGGKENLRIATRRENQRNRKKKITARSSKKGVWQYGKWWFSEIWTDDGRIFLGNFRTEELAHAAYCEAAFKYHGRFARVA